MNLVHLVVIAIFSCPRRVYSDADDFDYVNNSIDDGTIPQGSHEAFDTENFDTYCELSTDLYNAEKMPVPFTKNGAHFTILYPDIDDKMMFKTGYKFRLLCSQTQFLHANINNISELEVSCAGNNRLLYDGYNYTYDQLECKLIPKSELVVTNRICQGNYKYRVALVGFRAVDGMIVLYKVCFDPNTKNTLYTWYILKSPYEKYINEFLIDSEIVVPFNASIQLYGNMDVDKLYTVDEQRKTIGKILNSEKLAQKYIVSNDKNLLSPGQLTPSIDFYYVFEQIATYDYANTAPQWREFDENHWADLEESLWRLISDNGDSLNIVTGTHGSCTLADENGVHRALFLDPPKSVPVPLFYWKLVYNRRLDHGIVFVGQNNPYRPVDDYTFICPNTCPEGFKYDAFPLDKYEDKIYCCAIETFENAYGKFDPIVFQRF